VFLLGTALSLAFVLVPLAMRRRAPRVDRWALL
jgi:hypothetical protein